MGQQVKSYVAHYGTGGRDSTPVRGVLYEPVALLGESAELRLSRIRIGVVMLGAFLGFCWIATGGTTSGLLFTRRTTTMINYTKQRPPSIRIKDRTPYA